MRAIFHVVIAFFLLASGSAFAAQPGMMCVQKQLGALGFDAGPADGLVGSKTREAAEGYNAWAATRADGTVLPPLTSVNAKLWCDEIAKANPAVASFVEASPTVLVVQFRGDVPKLFKFRIGTERANTPDCLTPCTVAPMKEQTVRAESSGLAVASVEIQPEATRVCLQTVTANPAIDASELFLNDGKKKASRKGGDLEANGRSACSDSGSDAKLANTWLLTLK